LEHLLKAEVAATMTKHRAILFPLVILSLLLITASPLMSQSNQASISYIFPAPDAMHIGPFTSLVTSSGPPYITRPDLSNTMPVSVMTAANGTSDGLIFIANFGIFSSRDAGLLILDDSGEPVYLKVTTPGKLVSDFKVQVVNNTPYLVYHEGEAHFAWSDGVYHVMDDTYTVVDTWAMKNGYFADLHELQLLANGNGLMLAYVPVPMDLSPYGGPVDGTVIEIVIQELDSAKNVVFEWHSLDHIPLTDSFVSLSDSPVDYLHSNAIEVDTDGNLLVSNRNTSDIIKIDRSTGEIIWRLGGKKSQFTHTNDEGFSYQHDIRRLASGNISLFDNGNLKPTPYSRAVEYAIDETNKTITRTWQYPLAQDLFAPFMGNAQRLGGGNTMISWGPLAQLKEVKPDGSTALEMSFEGLTYRAFRFEWDAKPAELPVVAIVPTDALSVTLYMSWNGATQITEYEIYSGATVDSLVKIAATSRSGFETAATLTDLEPDTCVFKVLPVHAQGDPMPFSRVVYRLNMPQCVDLLSDRIYMPLFRH
jgi:hypothetical protein